MWSKFFGFLSTLGGILSPITNFVGITTPVIDLDEPVLIHIPDDPFLPNDIKLDLGHFIDRVVEFYQKQVREKKFDPYRLANVSGAIDNHSFALTNGYFIGLSNLHRIGAVWIAAGWTSVEIRAEFAIANASVEYDASIISPPLINFPKGHVHILLDNITIIQAYTYTYTTAQLEMSEFNVTLGNFNHTTSGLGWLSQKKAELVTKVVNRFKGPVLNMFSEFVRSAFNTAIVYAKSYILYLIPGIAGGGAGR